MNMNERQTLPTLDMKIRVNIKNVYGRELIYPICPKAKEFCALLGTKTLPDSSIQHIKALGFKILVKSSEGEI